MPEFLQECSTFHAVQCVSQRAKYREEDFARMTRKDYRTVTAEDGLRMKTPT